MAEKLLVQAAFDPKVKGYWLVTWIFVSLATIVSIPLLPLIIILIWFLSQKVLDAMSAELYERKLVVKRGIFTKIEKSIPLEKITDVGMVQGPLMRRFGIYRLSIETAGQSGTGALVSLLGVVDAPEFREKVLSQKDKVAGFSSSAQQEDEPKDALLASVKNIERLLERLVEKQEK